jgi:lipopolysaccharide/colanic/teichoic acid biosynthesis glycosyltransferase
MGQDTLPACNGALITDKPESPAQAQQLAQLKLHHIRLYSLAFLTESLTGRKSREALTDPLWQPDSNPAYDAIKRIVDCILVLLLSPFWVPLALLVGAAIRLDSPGPALFTQTRTGWHGKPFRIWKFRTMVQCPQQETQFALKIDARVTRLGRLLRKSRLDEIPQLVNVLLGHMSLIGPRPEQHAFVEKFAIEIPSYPYRHLVRPGLTGWAQVMQGYAASTGETHVKLQYDLYYVSHYSIALDLLITAKTIKTVLTGFGAR